MRWLLSKAGEGIVQGAAWALVVVVVVLLWGRARDDVEIPLWLLLLVVGVPATIAIAQTIRRWQVVGEVATERAEQMAAVNEHLVEVYEQLSNAENIASYANHLYDVLTTLRRSLAGSIPNVGIPDYIEHGVLEPARDLLRTVPGEDIRLSVLVPSGSDFKMEYAAGHTLESRHAFKLPISTSFSKISFEEGELTWSNALSEDERFFKHPRATPGREYESIISVPIRRGDKTVGVLNVISSRGDAFGAADRTYAKLIGAVIEIVWALPAAAESGTTRAAVERPSRVVRATGEPEQADGP